MLGAVPAMAEKQGGVLKSYSIDSPASMSIHEELTVFALRPAMAVFNNLVIYDQHVKQNSMQSIVPELAKSWTWDEDGTRLTFKLHEGVKWHDGKPFTAKDVKCTWDLLQGKTSDKLRINPRKAWYRNLEEVTINGDYEATFVLKRPQPAFIALLAPGFRRFTPAMSRRTCASNRSARAVQFVEFSEQSIKLVQRLLETRGYLDSIEY
jgi:peptide/nickel transport system substrate-binding protein